jgi:hypothetical protein
MLVKNQCSTHRQMLLPDSTHSCDNLVRLPSHLGTGPDKALPRTSNDFKLLFARFPQAAGRGPLNLFILKLLAAAAAAAV